MPSNRLPFLLATGVGLLLCFSIGYIVMHPAGAAPPADAQALAARVDELQKQLADLQAKVDSLAGEDILLADFDGPDYGPWTPTGTAFGTHPVQGTLENQNPVSGFLGNGLVNTYIGGNDLATGTLTSPPFKIERRHLNFLIAGGNFPNSTCINLLIDGKIVLTATGKNEEHLQWASWNVSDYAGKMATLEIVDKETGGWGHINIDQITLSQNSR